MAPPARPVKPAPSAGGGNLLTRQVGPLPGWGWLAVAVVGFLLYRRLSSSSSTSTPTGASSGQAPPTASVNLPGGYSYSGPASGAAAFQERAMGSPSPGNPGGATVSPGNTGSAFTAISDPQVGAALVASGVPVYTQVGPGGPVVPFQSGVNYPAGSSELYRTGSTAA